MKTFTTTKLVLVISGLLFVSGSLFSQAITPPTGLRWDLADMETPGKIAAITSKDATEDFIFVTANSSELVIMDNPAGTTDAGNTTAKCIRWPKGPGYAWSTFETLDKAKFIDMSQWEVLSFDVRVDGATLSEAQVNLNSTTMELANKWVTMSVGGVARPQGMWYPVSVDLTTLAKKPGVTSFNNVQKITVFINQTRVTDEDRYVYVDNFRLTRKAGTGLHDIKKQLFTIYPNPTTSILNVDGVEGKIEILNSLGQVVKTNTEFDSKSIDVSNLNNGYYFVKTTLGTQSFIKK